MSEQAETFVIVNYRAARARDAWSQVGRVLRARGVRFEAHEAEGTGDAQTAARAALRAGYRSMGRRTELPHSVHEPS